MANNFTSVINYFLKFTNFSFIELSRIPYINVIIGIFFIFAFADIVFLIVLHIRTRELKPINQGFLNILGNGFLSPLDKVPLGYKRFSPLLEQSPADFYRYDRSSVSPILHNDDFYRFDRSSILYQSAGGLNSFGGGLASIGSSGLAPIGSGGLGSYGGSSGSFGGGLSLINTRAMSESHTNLGLGSISRGGQYAVSSVIRGVDKHNRELRNLEDKERRLEETKRYHDEMIEATKNRPTYFLTQNNIDKQIMRNVEKEERNINYNGDMYIDNYDKHIHKHYNFSGDDE